MLNTVVISGEYVCCSVVFGVFVFSAMWSELLMTSAISCPLWSSVYECQRVDCAFTYPMRTECGMCVIYCMPCCMSVSYVLQCVDVLSSRRYINVCDSDVFSASNMFEVLFYVY